MDADALHSFVREQLAVHASAENAAAMQRYLKTEMPFFGVKRPQIRPVERKAKRAFPPTTRAQWETGVRRLWAGPERELKYVAIAYLKGFPRADFLDVQSVPLLEHLVRDGAWWDLVDDIAANAVGTAVRKHRADLLPVLKRWITDEDLWIRRTAILAQLKHREQTDNQLLFAFCLAQASDTSFWIRKAIGWALRQHARTDADAVRAFLATHGAALSGLSRREASKHL
ncbi:MAG: DNA alkylation repair protein [Myxococcales bacterium]|nr:DNA alkylation repair protein [Myxococcales bacterium]